MPTVSAADGPVAVTGASGYIGSWVVQDLLEQGYRVRACVRDTSNPKKVDHLLAMNEAGLPGQVELREADLFERGSYDDAFRDCAAVIHVGAPQGYNQETPQQVYDGVFTEMHHLVESVKKAGTVKRFVFTSSFAAVTHPAPDGYVFTEKDWCSDNIEGYKGAWTEENIPKMRHIAYKMAKEKTEKMLYRLGEESGAFEAMSIMPGYVIGPVMCANHDQGQSFQNWIKRMLMGEPYGKTHKGRMQWNITDVRDVARAHRLCIEREAAHNGSRYIIAAADDSGIIFTWQLQAKMKELFPDIEDIGGEEMVDGKPAQKTPDSQRAYSSLAMEELGLEIYPVDETIKVTGDSYIKLGLLPKP